MAAAMSTSRGRSSSAIRETSRRPLRIYSVDPMSDRFREPVISRVAYENELLKSKPLVDAWSEFLAHSAGDRGWVDGLRRFLPHAAELDAAHSTWSKELDERAAKPERESTRR